MSEGATEVETPTVESNSLFDDAATVAAATAPTPVTLSDDPPGYEQAWLETFMGGKYRTVEDGEAGVKALQGEYMGLKERFKSFTGAPVDAETGEPVPYNFAMPEGAESLPDDDPMMVAVNAWGQKHGLSSEGAQEAFDEIIMPLMAGATVGGKDAEQTALVDKYGSAEVAQAKAGEVYSWAAGLLPADMLPELKASGSLASTVIVLDALRAGFESRSMGAGNGPAPFTEQTVNELADKHGATHPTTEAARTKWAQIEVARRKAAGSM